MSGNEHLVRKERSATLSGPATQAEDKSRHRQISHRPHASHHLTIYKHPVKEGAQQLGAEIANFLNPARSTNTSAAPSRTVSRRPSREAQKGLVKSSEGTAPTAREVPPNALDLAKNVEDVHRVRQFGQKHLREGYDAVSEIALSSSRGMDKNAFQLQDSIKSTYQHLQLLRNVLNKTSQTLDNLTQERIPAVSSQHAKQLESLQVTYETLETDKIGDLERRLEQSRQQVQRMRDRMEKVRRNVSEWEVRDTSSFRRSRQRHVVFWTFIAIIVTAFLLLFGTRAGAYVNLESFAPLHHLQSAREVSGGIDHNNAESECGWQAAHESNSEPLPFRILDEL